MHPAREPLERLPLARGARALLGACEHAFGGGRHAPVRLVLRAKAWRVGASSSVAEDDERLRDAERERRGAEPTQVIARPRGTWMVLVGGVLVLLVAVAVWALRRDPADVPGVPAPTTATLATAMSAATTVPARALTSAAPVATASAPSIDAVAPAPSSPREPHAAPSAVRVTSPRPMPTPRTTDTVPGAPLPPSKDFTQAPL